MADDLQDQATVERARNAIIGAGMTGGGHVISQPLASHLARAAAPTVSAEQVEAAARLLGLPEWDEQWDEDWRREEYRDSFRAEVKKVLAALGIEVTP